MSDRVKMMWDNNMSRIVSICILNCAMPPFDMSDTETCRYVAELSDIPETELRGAIWTGLYTWKALPTPEEIRQVWINEYAPIDDLWREALEG